MRCFTNRVRACVALWLALGVCTVQAETIVTKDASKEEVASGNPATAKPVAKRSAKSKKDDGVQVELFHAMAEGQVDVEFIPKDVTQATVIVHNKSKEPLLIKLPATFAAIPVLGQDMGGFDMGGGGMGGGGGGGGGAQGMGGGMGGGGMGGDMGGMMGGGMFRVEADRPRKIPVATVCLEHGKLDPTPRMKYKMVPLAVLNSDPKVAELCKLLGQGKVSQNTAQAAAWHLANGLTWQQLAQKPKVISKYTGIQMYFSQFEVQQAVRVVAKIYAEVPERESDYDYDYGDPADRPFKPISTVDGK